MGDENTAFNSFTSGRRARNLVYRIKYLVLRMGIQGRRLYQRCYLKGYQRQIWDLLVRQRAVGPPGLRLLS